MSTHQRYLAQAASWDADGRPAAGLPGGYRLIALRCWIGSTGARAEGVEPVLHAYLRAAVDAQATGWLDAYFDEPEYCGNCGESYRFENVSLCTACGRKLCYRCVGIGGLAANGNHACGCGAGELVG